MGKIDRGVNLGKGRSFMRIHRSLLNRKSTRGGRPATNRVRQIEQLEPRLALTWAGTPPATISPPTTAISVTLGSANSASGAASIATTEVDYYAFKATVSGTYTIATTTPSSNLDTVLGVFSASGQRLAYNDDVDYPANTDSQVGVTLTAGTTYYVGITNYQTSSRGTYNWAITGPTSTTPTTDDAYENNDTIGTASNLGTLTTAKTINNLVMADANDWFRFTTTGVGTSTSNVTISFQNAQGNLQLALYNSSGSLLAASQSTTDSETISLSGRVAGTYYVKVYGTNGALNPDYTLTVNPPVSSSTPSSGGFQITLSMSGLTASQRAIFQQAADRWSQVITGDLPNATYRGQTVDDLLINASSVSIDGVNGILGQAGPDAFRSGSDLPYHGTMQFDSADMASMERDGSLFSVVLHEMGHVLGIGTIWEDLGLLSGAGGSNPIFTGTQATAAYNQIFGTNARGVPVENTGGSGTADSHWRESILGSELMTGWVGPGTNLPLSTITIGSLADLGYTVNFAAADTFTRSTVNGAVRSSVVGSSSSASLLSSASLAAASDEVSPTIVVGRPSGASDASQTVRRQATSSLPSAFVDLAMLDNNDSDNNSIVSRINRQLDNAAVDSCLATDQSLDGLANTRLSLS
jgi:hypothetical protein